MICILWLHCIYFLYRHSSTWSSTTYMYTLLLSVKEECCWRYLHGYCTSHPVRMNFENVNGGSSTVSTVSSKTPYHLGSSNHFNLFLKVICRQCKLQLYIWVTCTSCTMQVLNNSSVTVSHIIMWIQELWNSNTQYFSQRCEYKRALLNFHLDAHSNYCSFSIAKISCYMQALSLVWSMS